MKPNQIEQMQNYEKPLKFWSLTEIYKLKNQSWLQPVKLIKTRYEYFFIIEPHFTDIPYILITTIYLLNIFYWVSWENF